jgi:hypothetical protein
MTISQAAHGSLRLHRKCHLSPRERGRSDRILIGYPEKYQIWTGQFGLEIENEYINGARRAWRDGKTQVVEKLIDDIVVGIVAYLAGIKAKNEERARQARRWRYEARLRSVQQARNEREGNRVAFVEKVGGLAAEVRELQIFLKTMRELRPGDTGDDFSRMVAWVERRLAKLEGRLTGDGINGSLASDGLFPAVDPLVDPPPED